MDAEEHAHCVSCIQGFSCRQQSACGVIYCSNGCGVFTHRCKMEDHVKEVCPLARVGCPNQLYGCPKVTTRRNLSAHLLVCPAYVISCPYNSDLPDHSMDEEGKTTSSSSSSSSSSPELYGSKCRELVRRDAFSDHMRDHSHLRSVYDGWLEDRCPLSFLGCRFTFRRWTPAAAGHEVGFSSKLGAFVSTWEAPGAAAAAAAGEACHLLRLPPELLLRIGAHLDGLSLNSLAVTCRTMRSVCALLLTSKGCVSRRWVPREDGRWALDNRHRWQLNRSMEAIRRWTIADNGLSALHDHLKVCPFNERQEKSSEPALVMLVKAK